MNKGLKQRNPGCMLIAEDSTDYPNVTLEVDKGGLGFDYKWDMGWMHDTLEYFQSLPQERSTKYHKLTFSMMYFYKERYLLPLSHDEVVHGKATILNRMSGGYEQKFPQARAMYLYMMVHPGKKLNFMGNEIGQLREWDEKRQQDWDLRKYPVHDSFYRYMAELNQIYLEHPAMWESDYKKDGFAWLDCHQEQKCIYVIRRCCEQETLIAAFNFSNQAQKYHSTNIGPFCSARVLLYSDWERFGGTTPEIITVVRQSENTFEFELQPFSAILIQIIS